MYSVKIPVERPVWKDHKIIGYVTISCEDRDILNAIHGIGVYFGFTDEEMRILNDGTEEELREAGFLED